MADYGAWAGLGDAIGGATDAYSKAKKARADAAKEAAAEALTLEQANLAKQKFERDTAEDTPTVDAPAWLGMPGVKLTRKEAVTAGLKKSEMDAKKKEADDQLKRLPTTGVNMQDLSSFPTDLSNLASLADDIKANADVVGPVAGKVQGAASLLPVALQPESTQRFNELNGKIANLKQTIGKFKEGGVLRAEDEVKYNKILANVLDNPAVAGDKIQAIHDEMAQKYNATLKTLAAQGYRTAGLNPVGMMGKKAAAPDKKALAQQALNDPEASPEEKAQAKRILGMP